MKIVAVPVATAEAKQTLPEPEVTFNIDAENGNIQVIVDFKGLDVEQFQKSKRTLYFSKTLNPVNVEFGEEGAKQVLAIDTQGRQPLQFRCGISAPLLDEKEKPEAANGASSEAEASDDDDAEAV